MRQEYYSTGFPVSSEIKRPSNRQPIAAAISCNSLSLKGKLETVPEEKAVVQLVFDMFLNRNMGYTAISGYLNRNGYTRPPAKNAIRPSYGEWSSDHIKRMLSNPVYTGRVAWGKRRTEKVPGKDKEVLEIEGSRIVGTDAHA